MWECILIVNLLTENGSGNDGDVPVGLFESEALGLGANDGLDGLTTRRTRIDQQRAELKVLQKRQLRETLLERPHLNGSF